MSDVKKPAQTTSNGHGFDAGFDAFLREEDSRLVTLYRKLPHPEPDAALDAYVRAHAHRALREDVDAAAPAGKLRARRWLPTFGAAATLVLAAGLAWRLMPSASPTREAASGAATAPGATQGERATPMPATAAPPTSVDATAQYRHKLHRVIAGKPESSATADNAGAEAKPAASIPAPPSAIDEPAAFPPSTKSAPPAAVAPPQRAAEPAEVPEAETSLASVVAAAHQPPLREAADVERAVAAQAFVAGAAAGGSSFAIGPDPSSAPSRYRWEIAATAAAPARSGVYPPDPPPPAAWVEIVRAMLRDGRRDAARQALADLRARHPDFRVPSDLRGLE
ncbi:MAG: hypothetical protein QM741_18020 [Rudaea sp.]|uniref:hypothetical protein n=1 Tax=Rudaea sp. TaxID=2136325 RepID=UPI0039E5DA63